MEQQENRNGTNVIEDIKDGINLFGASTGNPIKYTWNIFGMAIVAVGSIILLKGNQMVRGYMSRHYSGDQAEDKLNKANLGMNSKLSTLADVVSSVSFSQKPSYPVSSSEHGQKTINRKC